MTNFEYYYDDFMGKANIMFYLNVLYREKTGDTSSLSGTAQIFKWLHEEHKEPILNDAEREYLKAVCKPFRNKVKSVQKLEDGLEQCIFINLEYQSFSLPSFDGGTMYGNMKLGKEYTLEELGITYDE